jgi:hypothetical protein
LTLQECAQAGSVASSGVRRQTNVAVTSLNGLTKNFEIFLHPTLKFLMSCPITSQKGGKASKKYKKYFQTALKSVAWLPLMDEWCA